MDRLNSLRESTENCELCSLSQSRNRVVFGSGDRNARVFLIGEAPGRSEDLGGEPFIGQAGKMLDEALRQAGLTRSELFIANVLKCRPPKNRNPKREEIDMCGAFLVEQIECVDPEVIVPMGNFALRFLAGKKATIGEMHGEMFIWKGRTVLPIYHPAAILYNRGLEPVFHLDFVKVARILTQSKGAA